jgi:hypothetical protein
VDIGCVSADFLIQQPPYEQVNYLL